MPHATISITGLDLSQQGNELRVNSDQIDTLIDRLQAARSAGGETGESRDPQEKQREESFGAL